MLPPLLSNALATCVLLASAIGCGAGAAAQPAHAPVYSVAQVARDLAHLARQPAGRWLLVRGVVWGCDADVEGPGRRCMTLRPLIVDPATGARLRVLLSLDGDACPLQHVRWGRPATYRGRVVDMPDTGGYAVDLPDTDAAKIYEQGRG